MLVYQQIHINTHTHIHVKMQVTPKSRKILGHDLSDIDVGETCNCSFHFLPSNSELKLCIKQDHTKDIKSEGACIQGHPHKQKGAAM